MTHVVGDATHIKGKSLSGSPQSGETWVFDGTQYVPGTAGTGVSGNEAYRHIEVDGSIISADSDQDTLHLSGVSGIHFIVTSGSGSGSDSITAEVSGLLPDQIPSWDEISGLAAQADTKSTYTSGVVSEVSGLVGFVMASGDGLAVTVPGPISGRVLKASGTNPLTDLYWAVDQTDSGGSGSGYTYAYISVQGVTTLDANSVQDTLNLSGRSGVQLAGASGLGAGEDAVFFEVSGLSPGQIPAWSDISGMAASASGAALYASGKLDDTDGSSGFVMASGAGLIVLPGIPASGQILKWSGSDVLNDAYFGEESGQAAADNLQQLENTVAMLAWDIYSDDKAFSDIAVDDFENQTGIDRSLSTYSYDASGSFCGPLLPGVDYSKSVEITQATDVERSNLFNGDTIYWQQTSQNKGYFSSDSGGSTRKTIKLGGSDYPEVKEGIRIEHASGANTIINVLNDGDQDDEVELDSDLPDATEITGAYGLAVNAANGGLDVNKSILQTVYGHDNHGSVFGNVTDETIFNETMVPNNAYVTKVGIYTNTVLDAVKVKRFTENGSNFDVTDIATDLNHTGSGYEEWALNPPFQIPASGNHHIGVYCGSGLVMDIYHADALRLQGHAQSGDISGVNQSFNTPAVDRGYGIKVSYEQHYIASGQHAANTSTELQVNTGMWTDVTNITPVEVTPGASNIYYATCLNKGSGGEEWWVVPEISTSCSFSGNLNWDWDLNSQSIRTVIKAQTANISGAYLRITLKAHMNAPLLCDHVSIGVRSGETANCTTTPTEIFFDGTPGCNIPPGQSASSDWTAFDFDESVDHLVIMDYVNLRTMAVYTENGEGFYWTDGVPYDGYDATIVSGHELCAVNTVALTKVEVSDWRGIARNSSGTWQYKDAAGTYQKTSDNTRFGALTQAFEVSENQMEGSELADIGREHWDARLVHVTNDGTLDFAFGFQSDGDDAPRVDKITVTYQQVFQDMELVTESWEASSDNPSEAYCVMHIEPMEPIILDSDLQAFVSMDDGANYEQISGLWTFRQVAGDDYIRGDLIDLTPRGDKTMRLKIASHNSKNVRVHAAALGVKHT